MALRVLFIFLFILSGRLEAAPAADLDEQTRALAAELRCVVCQNLSVADSPSEMAQQMRASVREQLQAGKSPQEVKDYFVSKYGEWVLLAPTDAGFNRLLWWLPITVLILGIITALWFVHRWTAKKSQPAAPEIEPAVAAQLRSEIYLKELEEPALEDSGPRAQLLRERLRLKNELDELEFDFQSGKLSESDHGDLRRDVEGRAALVFQELNALPPPAKIKEPAQEPPARAAKKPVPENRTRFRRWQLAAGGAFLLLFGLALGILLTQSLRPRTSEQDTLTGDFLTGTSAAKSDIRSALDEGKRAFANQELPKAIDAFKKVLAIEPNQPEAHSYMGFILVQAGHADGALLAFDKALAQAPNFPMALWGKAMILYRGKKDYAGARPILEKLLQLIPPGEDRQEIENILASLPGSGSSGQGASSPRSSIAAISGQSISGKITLDAKVKGQANTQATLFIIARPAGAVGGPPLAVKKIDRAVFPLSYSISSENVMMQGTPFTGKINLTVRLDKDGNPATRAPGDLVGDYKNNPVDVGAKNIDIVIDRAL
ncbi:MAG: tetratricopeptide repeat protein [Deltaproteobacteria bacterium]|nr:tetratricopeptide repeat protein [Deltaproteobacteria bacterium]